MALGLLALGLALGMYISYFLCRFHLHLVVNAKPVSSGIWALVVIYLRVLDSVLTLDDTIFLTCDIKGCNSISESKNTPRYENFVTNSRVVLLTWMLVYN